MKHTRMALAESDGYLSPELNVDNSGEGDPMRFWRGLANGALISLVIWTVLLCGYGCAHELMR